jgi:hypothetical protein
MNIIEMDKQATYDLKDEFGNWIGNGFDKEKFAELVAAHEREKCAKMVDHILKYGGGTYGDAIRARSKA